MERAVPQGAGQALAVGNKVLPQSSLRSSRGQAPKHSFAVLCLWADSGQGCAIQCQGEPFHWGWSGSHDPQVIGTAVVCGEGWTRLPAGHTAGLLPAGRAQLHQEPDRGVGIAQSWQQRLCGCRSSTCEDFPLLFLRCLLRCTTSPKTLYRRVAMTGR